MTEGDAINDPRAGPGSGWFHRHPRLAMALPTLALLLPADLMVGTLTNRQPVGAVRHHAYHHGLAANVDERVPWGQGSYRRITNSLGLRDGVRREVPLHAEPGHRRILFIGDSFTEGVGIDWDRTFVGRVAAALAPRGIEVLDAGVQSYSPKLAYLKVKYLVETARLSFDEIEMLVDVSDVQDELMYESFVPGFTWDHVTHRASDWLTKHSLIARTILDRLRERWSQSVTRSFGEGGLQERALWTVDDRIWRRYGARGMALAQENLDRLVAYARAHGMPVHVIVYPWPEQIRARDLESKQVTMWRDFARRENVGFTNLFPDFFRDDAEAVIKAYFIDGDSHWNESGHALVARRWLQDRGYVLPPVDAALVPATR
ncbi:MAG TPA: SGNH/GDSL hydrolase family protein [Polyangia bacterium]|nr:SGNH/GDSL hydrolase family protein [Polyangia bacterium]